MDSINNSFTKEHTNLTKDRWDNFLKHRDDKPMIVCERVWDELPKSYSNYNSELIRYVGNTSPEEAIQIHHDYLSSRKYIGATSPIIELRFCNSGNLVPFLGGKVTTKDKYLWSEPLKTENLGDLPTNLDRKHDAFLWMQEFIDIALDKWDGGQVNLNAIEGGAIDVLAALRGDSELCMDLLEEPEEVKRLIQCYSSLWLNMVEEDFHSKVLPINKGSAACLGTLSKGKTCRLNSDFCNMISPDLYQEFVLPDILAACKIYDDPCYHLDGTGQLAHLDFLLSIEKMRMIEWVPGAGEKPPQEWGDVIEKIRSAGKRIQFFVTPEQAIALKEQHGLHGMALFIGQYMSPSQAEELLTLLNT